MRDLTIKQIKKMHESGAIALSRLYWYEGLLKKYRHFMLNYDALPVSEMPAHAGGQVFWRSNSPFKEPAGQIVSARKARRIGGDCYYASQKLIDYELRVYWKRGWQRVVRRATPKNMLGRDSTIEHPVLDELELIMPSYVIDFAISDGRSYILEMNPPEASGIYGRDVWP